MHRKIQKVIFSLIISTLFTTSSWAGKTADGLDPEQNDEALLKKEVTNAYTNVWILFNNHPNEQVRALYHQAIPQFHPHQLETLDPRQFSRGSIYFLQALNYHRYYEEVCQFGGLTIIDERDNDVFAVLFARACLETGRLLWLDYFNFYFTEGLSREGCNQLQTIFQEAHNRYGRAVLLPAELCNRRTSGLNPSEAIGPHRMLLSQQNNPTSGDEGNIYLPTESNIEEDAELDLTPPTPRFNLPSVEAFSPQHSIDENRRMNSSQRIPSLCNEENDKDTQPIYTIFTKLPHQQQE